MGTFHKCENKISSGLEEEKIVNMIMMDISSQKSEQGINPERQLKGGASTVPSALETLSWEAQSVPGGRERAVYQELTSLPALLAAAA